MLQETISKDRNQFGGILTIVCAASYDKAWVKPNIHNEYDIILLNPP